MVRTIGTTRRIGFLFLALAAALPAGCGARNGSRLAGAVGEYQQGRYASAAERAEAVRKGASSPVREQAAYLAGLCAFRLGDLDAAERDLRVAARSTVASVRGPARASLGLALLEAGRPSEAASELAAATGDLPEPDRRRAAAQAGRAYAQAGVRAAAERWLAGGPVGTGEPSWAPDGRTRDPGAGAFTIQVGAFLDRGHAERAAADASGMARRHGLAPAEIFPLPDGRGRTLYVVRLGRFSTRGEADLARSRLGSGHFIVAAVAG